MRGRLFQFLLFSVLLFLIISNTQNYTKESSDIIVQPHHSQNSVGCIQHNFIAQDDDLVGPTFGNSWPDFSKITYTCVIITAGSEGLYFYTFSDSVFDESGIDTILLYYHLGQIDNWNNLDEESWIQWTDVSYDDVTHECSATVQFNPPIYDSIIYAYFWANDTYGHASRGGFDGFNYNGVSPIIDLNFINQNFFGLFAIGSVSIIGITCLIIKKRSEFSNS